jgi:hypothetical protein
VSLRDDLLPVAALEQQLAAQFGLSRYAVAIRTRTWNVAIGDPSGFSDSVITVTPSPAVSLLSPFAAQMAGIMMAGGTIEDRYWKLDKFTPQYTDPTTGAIAGYTPPQLAPMAANERTEITYLLTGDGGVTLECNLVAKDFTNPFEYSLTVREKRRRTEQNAP